MYHGLDGAKISRILLKPDGINHWSETAIQNAVNKIEEDPDFRGEREEGSGAPRKTTKKQDRDLYKMVMREKGKRSFEGAEDDDSLTDTQSTFTHHTHTHTSTNAMNRRSM